MRTLEYLRDILGLIGTIIATIPFYREMGVKRDLQKSEDKKGIEGEGALAAFGAIAKYFRRTLFMPDREDLALVTIGLGLLSASFVVSILLTVLKD
jgi:hypothetical protein